MNPVDLLGAKISIRVRIGMTHPYIEKNNINGNDNGVLDKLNSV